MEKFDTISHPPFLRSERFELYAEFDQIRLIDVDQRKLEAQSRVSRNLAGHVCIGLLSDQVINH